MQCAPARAAQSLPCAEQPERSEDRSAALTGLGLAARVGNLQPEGEPGERGLCPAASLPLAARKRLSQVLLSSIAGPVPGAGRWLAPPSPRHRLRGWARRNAPPGGSEFPFRCGSSFSKLVLQGGEGGWGVPLWLQCLPAEKLGSSYPSLPCC